MRINGLSGLTSALNNLDLGKPQREQAEVALAQVLSACGNLGDAQALVAKQTGDYADHEDVLLSISARQLEDASKRLQNKKVLNKISEGVKNATAATMYLGELEFANENYHAALEHFLSAQTRAPAWMLPLERILICYQKLDEIDQAGSIEQEIKQRKQSLRAVLTGT